MEYSIVVPLVYIPTSNLHSSGLLSPKCEIPMRIIVVATIIWGSNDGRTDPFANRNTELIRIQRIVVGRLVRTQREVHE